MLIRTEAPADILLIDKLLRSAFETEAEADLVMSLRENGHLTLSLVASTDEGEIVGHVLFSPVTLNGEQLGWQGMAPVAVKSAFRKQGIAGKMITEGLSTLYELGYPACVVLGEPAFYTRFGFVDAAELNMRCSWDVPQGAFRAIALAEDEFSGKSGLVEYSPEFLQM